MKRIGRRQALGLGALSVAGGMAASTSLMAQEKKGARGLTFEIYKDKSGDYRFRLKASNGQIIAQGQGYQNKADCTHAIEVIQKGAADAKVVEEEDKK
jgi:uncharacterized protein